MPDKKINLEVVLKEHLLLEALMGHQKDLIIKAMKEACRQVLELAAENAECNHVFDGAHGCIYEVNQQSIINTIKQIE